MNKIFDEIEDLVLFYATDDYDYKKSVALFNVGKIEKMVDYCRYLQHQLEEKGKENQQLKKQKDDVVIKYIKYLIKRLEEFDILERKETGAFWYQVMGELEELLRMLGEKDEL